MQGHLRNIFIAAAILLAAVSCSRGPRVIPADRLSKIYAEMFLVDQWVRNDRELSRMADTSLVYEPVLNKYGYTTDDYLATVDEYLKTPGDFAKIFVRTAEMLRARLDDIVLQERILSQIDSLHRVRKTRGCREFTNLDLDSLFLPASKIDSMCGITTMVPPSVDTAAVVPDASLGTAVKDMEAPAETSLKKRNRKERPEPINMPEKAGRELE